MQSFIFLNKDLPDGSSVKSTGRAVKKVPKNGSDYGQWTWDDYDPEDYGPLMFEAGKKRV